MDVTAALRALNSPLKLDLLRHYARHGGSMGSAARALDANLTTITRATSDLIEAGVVHVEQDANNLNNRSCQVDTDRLDQLLAALASYARGM